LLIVIISTGLRTTNWVYFKEVTINMSLTAEVTVVSYTTYLAAGRINFT